MKWLLSLLLLGLAGLPAPALAWWNKDWTERRAVTLDPSSVRGMAPLSRVPVLVRLHSGVFDFTKARPDGGDLRFVAGDDKTPLNFHIERFDPTAELALIWIDVPKFDAGAPQKIWLYYGNAKAAPAGNPTASFDGEQSLVLHFSEAGGAPQDQTANRNRIAAFTGKPTVEGLIAGGASFAADRQLRIAPSQSLTVPAGGAMTWSAWIKPQAGGPAEGLVFTKLGAGGEGAGPRLSVGLRAGVPFVRLIGADGQAKEAVATTALTPASWAHLALTAGDGKINLYANGMPVATVDAALPALDGEEVIGAAAGLPAFQGDVDEVGRANAARAPAAIALAAQSQGRSSTVVVVADKPDGGEGGGHNYFGVLINALTPDAWAVIALLGVMALISWVVMITKGRLVRSTTAANAAFLDRYRQATASGRIHHGIPAEEAAKLGQGSTLARIYKVAQVELGNRLDDRVSIERHGIARESVASIRAAMDASQVVEGQRLNKWMVLLTIAISGGPFLGLLGTVVGVMITFAGVAAAGDVNINAIAPGIAAALLATVAGLAVAIPALFGYNYLVSRIEEIGAQNEIFVDEVETRIAETWRAGAPAPFPTPLPVAAE